MSEQTGPWATPPGAAPPGDFDGFAPAGADAAAWGAPAADWGEIGRAHV